MTYRMEDGWRKISHTGGTFVTGKLYNVNTGESVCITLADFDDVWRAFDKGDRFWYDASIDWDAHRAYCRKNGIIIPGEKAMVIKGRKIEHGFVGLVTKTRDIRDRYGRWVAEYVVFEDGRSTNVDNCVLVLD